MHQLIDTGADLTCWDVSEDAVLRWEVGGDELPQRLGLILGRPFLACLGEPILNLRDVGVVSRDGLASQE